MISKDACERLVREKLSPRRVKHVLAVRDMALQLAQIYGADEKKAEVAALLHDIVKEESPAVCLRYMQEDGTVPKPLRRMPSAVLHAPAGACYARGVLGVADADICSAIACHTTGKRDMSLLDKILFAADKISAERDYPGVEGLRRKALSGRLDEAVADILRAELAFTEKKGGEVDPATQEALASLAAGTQKGERNG